MPCISCSSSVNIRVMSSKGLILPKSVFLVVRRFSFKKLFRDVPPPSLSPDMKNSQIIMLTLICSMSSLVRISTLSQGTGRCLVLCPDCGKNLVPTEFFLVFANKYPCAGARIYIWLPQLRIRCVVLIRISCLRASPYRLSPNLIFC